ncbi:MAG: ATP-binding cassette domain-containing protein [Acidimicrobiales bacterium]
MHPETSGKARHRHRPRPCLVHLPWIRRAGPAGPVDARSGRFGHRAGGVGKTTLIKLLTGMYKPTDGTIRIDGTPLTEMDPAEWALRSAGAFQDFVKFQTLTRHTVGMGDLERLDDRSAVQTAVERAHATSVIDQLDEGLDTQLGKMFAGTDLSHGQWQKLAVARGMMRSTPLLLVLDEPTAALDPQAEHDLFEDYAAGSARAKRAAGAITVLVSHRFSTVRMADLVFVLEDGTITEHGTHGELTAKDGTYAGIYRMQAAAYR